MKIQINSDQKKAIQFEYGPVLVVAGAGTGKTRVITQRIKHLIEDRGNSPKNIVALTFTEKATEEMLHRVDDVMPLGYEEPWINTFHSFADRILRIEGLEIGLDPSYKIISGPGQWLLLRKNIFNLGLEYFLPLGNPTKFVSSILKFISRLQDENISVDQFQKFSKDFFGKGEEKARLLELSHVYNRYQEIKLDQSKMDFGDLITWLIVLFKKRPNILEKYKQQFGHVLVDEFQDTNYAQYELIKLLCPSEDLSKRSLLVVGDDSQSIYKFRGAAVSNILEFQKDYPKSEMVTLLTNYRSNQEILDSSYELIQNNNPDTLEAKLGISKKLLSAKTGHIRSAGKSLKKQFSTKPVVVELAGYETEVEFVISKIIEILGKETQYTFKDIAILARANNHLEPFIMGLRKHGLPYQLVGNRGLYDRDEVKDIIALLKVVVNPKDDISLYRLLTVDSLNISSEVVSEVLSAARVGKVSLWDIVKTSTDSNVALLTSKIREFQDRIPKHTPTEFVYDAVTSIEYLRPYLLQDTVENTLSIKNLDLFLNRVKSFEVEFYNENRTYPTLVSLVEYLEMIIEAGDNPAQAQIEDIDTINLMTVHASKGLEFKVVFIVNLVSGRFPTRDRTEPIQVPDELIKETLPLGDPHIQEERRLFYVGMTRAENYLFLTYAKNYGGKRDSKKSGFVEELGNSAEHIAWEAAPRVKEQETLFGVNSDYRKSPLVKKTTENAPSFLSYSQISTYLTCPLKYRFSYILNIPRPPSHALSFGSTIHDTLRDFHQKKLFGFVSLDELLEMYKKNWQPLGFMDEQHRLLYFEKGIEVLTKYHERHAGDSTKPLALERSFNIRIDGIKFYGKIDRIDRLEDGSVEIMDYKTGSLKDQKEVDKDSQLAFYAMGVKEAMGLTPKKLTYYFVEDGEMVSTTRNELELKAIRKEVTDVAESIKKGEFEAKSGMHCNWCDFKDYCPFAYKG